MGCIYGTDISETDLVSIDNSVPAGTVTSAVCHTLDTHTSKRLWKTVDGLEESSEERQQYKTSIVVRNQPKSLH